MATRRGITLKRYGIAQANHYYIRGFRMKVEAVDPVGDMTSYVFVYRRYPPDPYTQEVFDEFVTVASFVDLDEYPVGEPDPQSSLPFFRSNVVELDFRSAADAEEAWNIIRTEVCALVDALNRADNMVLEETASCGDASEESDSSGESESL